MSEPVRGNWSPPVVAFVAWLLPGGGYLLIGQRARGLTVGITIIVLFFLGLLVGGVRALEVPGWDENGWRIRLNAEGRRVHPDDASYPRAVWVLRSNALSEIRAKPWVIPQFLAGPVGWVGAAWSIWASSEPGGEDGGRGPPGVVSHGRVNEIGVLYTAVAGVLNLLAMIDSAHRAAQAQAVAEAQAEAA